MRIQRQRDTFAYRVADLEKTWADDNSDLLDRLHGEFHKWWEGWGSAYDPQGYWTDNPLNSWRNIESFLEAKYPQSYRGFDMGLERARPLIDQIEGTDSTTHYDPYETGIDAAQKYGYDPKEIAAGMLLLHNRSHGEGRSDLEKGDLDRLSEIARIRSQQYRDYEKKKTASGFAYRLATAVSENLLKKLKKEFDTWAVDYAGESQDIFGDRWNRGPIGEWWNVERFLEDNYPAAYRGLGMGMEDAGALLDKSPEEETPWFLKNYETIHGVEDSIADYETGPEAVAQHGYDPKETVAAMLLLHNRSHPLRSDLEKGDLERLNQIAQARSRQQRAYEQNKVASGYSTVHEKVRKDKGAPSGHSCVDCGKKADHWTYDHSSDSEKTKTNDSLPYSTDTKHYSPRCRSCHNKLDKK